MGQRGTRVAQGQKTKGDGTARRHFDFGRRVEDITGIDCGEATRRVFQRGAHGEIAGTIFIAGRRRHEDLKRRADGVAHDVVSHLAGKHFVFHAFGANDLPGARDCAAADDQEKDPSADHRDTMPADDLLQHIPRTWRARGHRLILHKMLEIHGEGVGGFVPTSAILLKAAHRDPIEVALDEVDQLRRLRLT